MASPTSQAPGVTRDAGPPVEIPLERLLLEGDSRPQSTGVEPRADLSDEAGEAPAASR